jgi:hypothetical protein
LRNIVELIQNYISKYIQTKKKHLDFILVYRSWQAFVRYLQEQIFDLKQIQDRSSPIYAQV